MEEEPVIPSAEALDELVIALTERVPQPTLFSPVHEARPLLEWIVDQLQSGGKLYQRWPHDDTRTRWLAKPLPPLYQFIKQYVVPFIEDIEPDEACHGYRKGWSPSKSLGTHFPCRSLFSFDLSKAFENVEPNEVYHSFAGLFVDHSISYFQDDAELGRELAKFLTQILLVPYQGRGFGIPQGAPHGNALFNQLMSGVDYELRRIATRKDMTYSRWGDDLLLGHRESLHKSEFIGAAHLVEKYYGIRVARHKVFFQHDPIFALGHVMHAGGIRPLREDEEDQYKGPCLSVDEYNSPDVVEWTWY